MTLLSVCFNFITPPDVFDDLVFKAHIYDRDLLDRVMPIKYGLSLTAYSRSSAKA